MNHTQASDSNRSIRWELGGGDWGHVDGGTGWGAWRRGVASTLQGGDRCPGWFVSSHFTERGGGRQEPTRWGSTGPALRPRRAEVSPLPGESWAPAFSEEPLSFRKSGPTTKGRLSSWEKNIFSPCHFIEFGGAFCFSFRKCPDNKDIIDILTHFFKTSSAFWREIFQMENNMAIK